MTTYPPTFEKVYVISDIHMGGQRDDVDSFQVFNQGTRLARFIGQIAQEDPKGDVALVINGDLFDFLAEDVGSYVALDAAIALRTMKRLYTDESFSPVWQALAAFVQTPHRHLIIIVGNHDIELALPVVEHSIREALTEGDAEASARMVFSSVGAGYSCQVGRSRIFCTHGNELDAWNWVDYSALGQLANAMNGARRIDAARWQPNAGTRLVIDVMNVVKRQLPFVDLLKPESASVASVLMTVDLDLMKKVKFASAWPILRDKRKGLRLTSEILGAYAADMHVPGSEPASVDNLHQLVGPNLRAMADEGSSLLHEDELLLDAERARSTGLRDMPASGELEVLGGRFDLFAGLTGLRSRPEALRRALMDWLADDRTFETSDPKDSLYLGMADRVTNDIDFVVTGHTHQPRAMTYDSGCHYFNAGTWIRSIRITTEALDARRFETDVWPLLRGRMDQLDAARIPGPRDTKVPLVVDRTTAVCIGTEKGRVVGELLRVRDKGRDGISVTREDGTTALEGRSS
jgi:UDP-2,3-diacylglucosamine pyrophosphatase LpxH